MRPSTFFEFHFDTRLQIAREVCDENQKIDKFNGSIDRLYQTIIIRCANGLQSSLRVCHCDTASLGYCSMAFQCATEAGSLRLERIILPMRS